MKFYWKNRFGSLFLSLILTLIIAIIILNFRIVFLFEGEIVKSTIVNFLLFIVMIITALYGYLVAFGVCKLIITEDEIINTLFAFYHLKMKRDDIRYVEIDEVKTFIFTKKIVRVYGNNINMSLPNFGKNAENIKEILDKPLTMTSYYDQRITLWIN